MTALRQRLIEYGVEHNGQIGNTHRRVECDVCSGTGTTGEKVPYFDNNALVVDVAPSAEGWLTCPDAVGDSRFEIAASGRDFATFDAVSVFGWSAATHDPPMHRTLSAAYHPNNGLVHC